VSDGEAARTFTFLASLPPIQSAITLDGQGDGARVKLDIPRSDVDAALLLQAWGAGKPLRVTVEVLEDERANRTKSRKIKF
jgi:hypothetical protein